MALKRRSTGKPTAQAKAEATGERERETMGPLVWMGKGEGRGPCARGKNPGEEGSRGGNVCEIVIGGPTEGMGHTDRGHTRERDYDMN